MSTFGSVNMKKEHIRNLRVLYFCDRCSSYPGFMCVLDIAASQHKQHHMQIKILLEIIPGIFKHIK